jgi:hypothetical protein
LERVAQMRTHAQVALDRHAGLVTLGPVLALATFLVLGPLANRW